MYAIEIEFSRTITDEELQKNLFASDSSRKQTYTQISEGWQEELRRGIRRMLAEYETGNYQWDQWLGWILDGTGEILEYTREPLPATENDIIEWADSWFPNCPTLCEEQRNKTHTLNVYINVEQTFNIRKGKRKCTHKQKHLKTTPNTG